MDQRELAERDEGAKGEGATKIGPLNLCSILPASESFQVDQRYTREGRGVKWARKRVESGEEKKRKEAPKWSGGRGRGRTASVLLF